MSTCRTEGCSRPVRVKKRGLCTRCYVYWHRANRDIAPCRVDGCALAAQTRELCSGHYHRLIRYGDPRAGSGRGSPGKRRGIRRLEGWYITGNGYRRIRTPDGRWVDEHRVVMSEMLGRPLVTGESVHHRNGDKLDNDPRNLELWIRHQPTGQRVEDMLAWAREIIDRYGSSDHDHDRQG